MILLRSQLSVGNIKKHIAMVAAKTVPQVIIKFSNVRKPKWNEIHDTPTQAINAKPIGDMSQMKWYHNMTDKKKEKKNNGICTRGHGCFTAGAEAAGYAR